MNTALKRELRICFPNMNTERENIKGWRFDLSNISPKAKIGEGTVIHSHVSIHDEVIVGKNCQIEAYVFIPNGVTIEDEVFIGPHVCLTNDPKLNAKRSEWEPTPTIVKKGAKIGANATIRAGIIIGENAIVGCGSVVLKDIPPNETWVGNPAAKLR